MSEPDYSVNIRQQQQRDSGSLVNHGNEMGDGGQKQRARSSSHPPRSPPPSSRHTTTTTANSNECNGGKFNGLAGLFHQPASRINHRTVSAMASRENHSPLPSLVTKGVPTTPATAWLSDSGFGSAINIANGAAAGSEIPTAIGANGLCKSVSGVKLFGECLKEVDC